MKTQIKKFIDHFGLTILFLLAGSVCWTGCYSMRNSPFEVFNRHTNPIEGWKPISSIGCKVGYMSATIDTLPGYKAISDDVQNYVNKLPVDTRRTDPNVNDDRRWCYWIQDMMFYEDGSGQHAVSFTIPHDGTDWGHVLIYDKDDKRIKVIKYIMGHYRS